VAAVDLGFTRATPGVRVHGDHVVGCSIIFEGVGLPFGADSYNFFSSNCLGDRLCAVCSKVKELRLLRDRLEMP
jgi:hypothetical protein